jgi:hypothetical protein
MTARTFNAALLDKTIDDIEDLAGFEVPIEGIYTLKFYTKTKVINDKDAIEANFETIECVEQNDPDATPTKPGTKFGVAYFLDNDIAMGRFKALIAPVANHFGESNLATLVTETCAESQALIVQAKVKRRADKNDKEKFYADVSNLVIG